jgi:hypothetical protein
MEAARIRPPEGELSSTPIGNLRGRLVGRDGAEDEHVGVSAAAERVLLLGSD